MKAARKARQNTLGTARRKAHTPRHTQRRITAESTRRRLAPASLHAAQYLRYTRAQRHITAENTRRRLATACIRLDISAARVPSANASPRKRTPRNTQRRIAAENTRRRLAPASLHAARHLCYTCPVPTHRRESARRDTPSAASQPKAHAADLRQPACTRLNTSATRAQCHRIAAKAHAATFVNSMPLLHARRAFSTALRRDGRASEAPAIHSLPVRTLRLYYSAFCVQMRDIILPRGALFHHFLNVYTKGRPAAAKDTPPGDRPRAFIRFCR